MHKYLFLVLFVFVQIWTILIHDGDMISGHLLERYINSPAHHTLHHLYFTCNYGQVRSAQDFGRPLLMYSSTLHGRTRTSDRTAPRSLNSTHCTRR
jgi:sterol desaturase/sphingolipid hydroxylase (fatty acid hydroxylase superfamily)